MARKMNWLLALALGASPAAFAETVSVEIRPTPGAGLPKHMGAAVSPKQGRMEWDAMSLLKNGKPWLPVMGEIHFSRYPAAEWRDELLKMKAGGITMISTYVFWIYHEEERGKFTWDGDKDLRKFIQTCAEVGLPVIVRVGPWCHGEVRNGGFPDWVQAMAHKRTNDPEYLAAVKAYYMQVGQQLKGLYWKDDGPIIGIQFENEFAGPAAHLATLKEYGLAAGMDVPIYTRTAWDNATEYPGFGQVLPLWGGYAEGFWDRTLDTMPGNYWQVFQFAVDRAPGNAMGADPNAVAAATQRGDVLAYPYLTCELGGGMMSSYHRRINTSPMDVYTTALCKIGSGSNMPGYYMYHGGTNPDGKLSYLMESQSAPQFMWNDMPVKNYDFDAPLGACGEVRESYHLARELHMLLNDWGESIAQMPAFIAGTARNKLDTATVRWSLRSSGGQGLLFVNNYQRATDMPAKNDVKFVMTTRGRPGDSFTIPGLSAERPPVTIPANSAFIWPVGLPVGGGCRMLATAQPLCQVADGDTRYLVFAQTEGVPSDFCFSSGDIEGTTGRVVSESPRVWAMDVKPGKGPAITQHTPDGKKREVLLVSSADAKTVWRGTLAGREHIFISKQNLTFDGNCLSLRQMLTEQPDPAEPFVMAIPPLRDPISSEAPITVSTSQGLQTIAFNSLHTATTLKASAQPTKMAGALRTIALGSQRVAVEPGDADFDNAAAWSIHVPQTAGIANKALLRINYVGDVARVYVGDKFVLDDFYHGQPLDVALWRYSSEDLAKGLTVKILPLQKGAPIYMAKWPTMDDNAIATIESVEIMEERSLTLTTK
jgi:hypothetical protein